MKTIGINIDGVIRDSESKFDKQYRKVFIHNPSLVAMNDGDMTVREYTEEELDEIDNKIKQRESEFICLPMDSPNILNHYKFESQKIEMTVFNGDDDPHDNIELTPEQNFEKFMFEDYALQIFAQAEEIDRALECISKMQAIGADNNEFRVVLLSTCKKKAIPATYSFLALKGCKIKGLVFVNEDYQKWDYCDVLIDVSPEALQSKPQGKKSIKINTEYNKWDEANYSFDHVKNVCDKDFLKTIFE